MTEARYDREVFMEVVTYHCQVNDSTCLCGWGRRPEHLGRSHAGHVADVYELRAGGRLLMGLTKAGQVRHLTRDGWKSLCHRRLDRLVTKLLDGTPVPYQSHWANASLSSDRGLCEVCERQAGI